MPANVVDGAFGRMDPRYLKSLRSLEPALVREVVGDFLGAAASELTALRRATGAHDSARARSIAHRLKGCSGLLGAVGMSAALETIEILCCSGDLAAAPAALDRVEREFVAVRPVLEAELATAA